MRLLLTALLIWSAFAVPIALAVGRMLGGASDAPPPPPPAGRHATGNHLVRT